MSHRPSSIGFFFNFSVLTHTYTHTHSHTNTLDCPNQSTATVTTIAQQNEMNETPDRTPVFASALEVSSK